MKKLLVINSFGPMGSTLLAGLTEKLGFTNIPLRKLRLNQYLTGELELDSGIMQERLEAALIAHSVLGTRGGVSVLDRDNQKPRALTDTEIVREKLEELKRQSFSNVQDLYMACRNLYCEAIIYKEIKSNPEWHIEMTTDIHRFPPDDIYAAFEQHFDEVYMIHLVRDFRGWINSLASQAIVSKQLKNRLMFFPHMRYADFDLYERAIKAMQGLHINFDELFETPIEELAAQIADLTNAPLPETNLRTEEYDMYGKIQPYDIAFKKFDDNVHYLKPKTLDYFADLAKSGKINRKPSQARAWSRYLAGMCAYRMKHSNGP